MGCWCSSPAASPFDVAIEDKVALLLAANEAALQVAGARFVNSFMFFLRKEKTFASTEGTYAVQTAYRCWPRVSVTAVGGGEFQTRDSTQVAPRGLGWEYVEESRLVERPPDWAEDAVRKLTAKPVDRAATTWCCSRAISF